MIMALGLITLLSSMFFVAVDFSKSAQHIFSNFDLSLGYDSQERCQRFRAPCQCVSRYLEDQLRREWRYHVGN
jgi:hypothetical protein